MGRGFWSAGIGLLVAIAALAVSMVAEARDGCGRGYYFDGYACRPERYYRPPPGYYPPPPPRYYDEPPRYYEPPRRYYGPPPDEGSVFQFNFGGRDERRYAPPVRGRCQPGYTIQDGLCKPYRGY
jgi:hypothetical protein